MSLKTNVEKLSQESKDKIAKYLEIKIENKFGMGPPRFIYPYTIENQDIKLPFSFGSALKIPRPKREDFPSIDLTFEGELREEQKIVRKEALQILSSRGTVIVSAYPGFGKTIGAINLATSINFPTLIIVNKIVLIKQWEESIRKFCPHAIIKKPTAKTKNDESVHFYIMNAQNVEKMPKHFFKSVGTVIVDEAHMIMAETLSKSLQYVFPRYLIGLTATPYRPDGLDILLTLYFGQHKIIRKLYREHTAYRVDTGFRPPIERTVQGRVNWGAILDAQANNQDRNDLIINLIKDYSTRNFLVLVKRVEQGKYIVDQLAKQGESVTDLIGSNQEFDKDARILVGTCQKVGVGFDHAKLDALLLATDVEEYFVQYLGRVFRTKDTEPIIFDFVDNNNILIKHFNTRRKVYQEHGGTVKNFDLTIIQTRPS
jgi:superfamily II DNA or RNA helicase